MDVKKLMYGDFLNEPLAKIIDTMGSFNADNLALKFCDKKDEDKVIAGVFVVRGELANEIAKKIESVGNNNE